MRAGPMPPKRVERVERLRGRLGGVVGWEKIV